MRAIIMLFSVIATASAPAAADEGREPNYAPFDVAQSPPQNEREFASFDLAGAPVSLNAYGRKARARAVGAVQESDELRKLGGAFDRAVRPAVLTIEASVSF